ncbi:glycosyltransferase family 39 protein [Konateibacter massiliensis]|uniref:glycosyltransferase family 39 protein n=1 Tax=Konateibacter massiliensis TaxID=2002841 RepID=UPI000C1559CF|nr:glycosyltransferase family 39 protein [Konateibacter massiliensis]
MRHLKLNQLLYYFIITLLSFLVCCITLMAVNLKSTGFFSTFLYGYKLPVFLLACASFLFILLYFLCKPLFQLSEKQMKLLSGGILLLIFVLQVIFVLKMKASLRYDTLKVFDEAIALLNGETLSPDYSSGYFAKYPNNIPICIATALLLKLPKLFGVPAQSYMLYVQLVNAMLMSISYLFSYKLLCRATSPKIGSVFLFLVLFNPLTYLIAPFYYTHTFSMAFSTGAIYFFVRCMQEKENTRKRFLFAFLTGLLIAVGFKIRATVLIIAIAILVYLLLNIKRLSRRSLLTFAAFAAAALMGLGGYALVEKNYVKFNYYDTGYPATHWVMLGLQSTGGYNAADDAYTESFHTRKEKTEATEVAIIHRITSLHVHGLLDLWKHKMALTWSDGIDDFIDNISMTQNYGIKNDLISGNQNDILVTYCHVYHFFVLALLFIGTLTLFIQKSEHYLLIVSLNLLGGILFHICWEAGEVYNISFSCSMLVLAAYGFCYCFEKLDTQKLGRWSVVFVSASGLLTLLCLVYTGSRLTTMPITHYEYAARQDLAEPDSLDSSYGLIDDTLTQTFTPNRSFNQIGVKIRNSLGSQNCSSYKFQLLNSDGNILYETTILGMKTADKDYYRVDFNTIVPRENEVFQIKIIPDIVSDVHYLTFQFYDTGNYDIYAGGVLYRNNSPTDGDLTFYALNQFESSFLKK